MCKYVTKWQVVVTFVSSVLFFTVFNIKQKRRTFGARRKSYEWFTLSIKMSCDICDAWPAPAAGGDCAEQRGDDTGPAALGLCRCQLCVRQLRLSASWFGTARRGCVEQKETRKTVKEVKKAVEPLPNMHHFESHLYFFTKYLDGNYIFILFCQMSVYSPFATFFTFFKHINPVLGFSTMYMLTSSPWCTGTKQSTLH